MTPCLTLFSPVGRSRDSATSELKEWIFCGSFKLRAESVRVQVPSIVPPCNYHVTLSESGHGKVFLGSDSPVVLLQHFSGAAGNCRGVTPHDRSSWGETGSHGFWKAPNHNILQRVPVWGTPTLTQIKKYCLFLLREAQFCKDVSSLPN